MRRLPLALVLLVALAACDSSGHEPEVGGPDPADLRVRQTPNDTVRAGTVVTFTAVYADSLRAGDRVTWSFRPGFVEGRSVTRQTPTTPGVYEGMVTVRRADDGVSTLLFRTVVVP